MRASTSGASADFEMKSFAPASRARLLEDSSWLPEMTTTGRPRMRASADLRMRSISAKPSSFGMSRSENTMAIETSDWSASQPASPSASSRTANQALRMRLNVVRTNLESSTTRTRFCATTLDMWSIIGLERLARVAPGRACR
jgi:hypothetical protein